MVAPLTREVSGFTPNGRRQDLKFTSAGEAAMRKLANLISTIICVTGLVILSAVAAQAQGLNPSTTGALLTINGTVTDGTNSTPVNVSISDKDIVAATNQPLVGPGGASTCTAADEVPTKGYVLQAAAPTGCDPGDLFEGTILDGHATLSSTSGAVAYTFSITTHYQCGPNSGSCNFDATMTNTNGNIISGDTGFLTVTNGGPSNTSFVGTITLEANPGPNAAVGSGCTAGQPVTDSLTFTNIDPPLSAGQSVILALAGDSSGCGGFSSMNSFTTPPQTTTQGGSNSFTDPGGSGTVQTYVFPANTTFQNGNNSCSSPTMAIQFQYWDPALFNASRLPGVPQNPDWCGDGLNGAISCTTPVPTGTKCAQLSVNGKNSCIVEEAECFCGSTQLPQCNVTGVSGPILVSNVGSFTYASPPPVDPGLVIGDDGQNDWAIMVQEPDGATCTTNCGTQKLNTDIIILDVNQPDFSLAASPSPISPGVGGSAASTVSLSALNAFSSTVALSVPNPPAGVSTSFSTASVTLGPPSSASSALTVTVAPSVTPTSFTLNVLGANTSLNLNHYAFVTVNVVANTSSISSVITSLLSSGCIDNAGIANALTSKLSAAQSYINAGDNLDAINTLTAFNNQVNAQNGKHIHSTCTIGTVTFNPATVLISDAQSLITSLRVGAIADPITGYVLNSSDAGLQGATVSIVSGATTIATATTDITGFYYFATTNILTSGSTYTIKVTGFPTGYTTAAPAYSTFTWSGIGFGSNFTLN